MDISELQRIYAGHPNTKGLAALLEDSSVSPPKGKGAENIKASMNEAYAAVESALPEKYKGMVKNEDQDR